MSNVRFGKTLFHRRQFPAVRVHKTKFSSSSSSTCALPPSLPPSLSLSLSPFAPFSAASVCCPLSHGADAAEEGGKSPGWFRLPSIYSGLI
jgi:hypothetical protein